MRDKRFIMVIKKFRHGSLFSGIGGFDLAAEWMNWENVFHCEMNPFGQRVLKYYWPNAQLYEDIKKTDFTKYYGTIDLISGGFPCQPYSTAGKRQGKNDERHLWPEMLRAIKEVAPRWVVGENVRGLTNWNGGMVFDEVCTDLENIGYQVAPYLIPACAVNAPHRRERIWFVAYRNASDTNKERLHTSTTIKKLARERFGWMDKQGKYWKDFPTQSPICSGDDGLPGQLDGITFSKWRNESLKAYGNAVVPQVVYQIFKCIELFHQATK